MQEASACSLKVAHRNAACVVQAGVHISCVFTRFLSFMICSLRTGHPTEVFRFTRVSSSPHLRTGNFRVCGNRVPARFSSSVFVARVLRASGPPQLTYLHILSHPLLPRVCSGGPSLDKPPVSIFAALSCASIHQWFDGPAQVTRFKHFVEVVLNWVPQADSVCLRTACLQVSHRQSPWSRATYRVTCICGLSRTIYVPFWEY